MRKAKRFSLILLSLSLFLALTACGEDNAAPVPVKEGEACRDFTAALADGGTFTLSEQRGKAVLLNFWATWCGPCVREMPAFTRLIETYGDRLALVTVNCQEDEATVQRFLSENGYTFPVVLDPEGEVGMLYPTDGIPYTLIITPDGTISSIQQGAGDAEAMFIHYSELLDRALQ